MNKGIGSRDATHRFPLIRHTLSRLLIYLNIFSRREESEEKQKQMSNHGSQSTSYVSR